MQAGKPFDAVNEKKFGRPRRSLLRRVLGFWSLFFYGLGVIVGAGIYVAIGEVIERAGSSAPLSFLLAGIAAGATGLCYAELASRFPEASGAVAYVRQGFGSDRLALITGIALTIAVAVAAASIARGSVHYLGLLLPVSAPILTALLVAIFTAVAVMGVGASVGLAAALGAIEIAGLLAAAAAGFLAAPDYHAASVLPSGLAGWHGTISGAFIAFFAFIGFESLANLAEEVVEPERTLPLGIIGAIGASIALYIMVATAAVFADQAGGNPLLGLFSGNGATAFALVASVAVANGVLVEIVMLARLFYGMARAGQLPTIFGKVHPRTQTPITATVCAGAIILAAAALIPFEHLLVVTNTLTLSVFVLVDLALWRLRRQDASTGRHRIVPRLVPLLAAVMSAALIGLELLT